MLSVYFICSGKGKKYESKTFFYLNTLGILFYLLSKTPNYSAGYSHYIFTTGEYQKNSIPFRFCSKVVCRSFHRHIPLEVERVVRQDEEVANQAAGEANKIRLECEAELNLALPMLEEATAALNTIKQDDIVFIKAMKNPPQGVKLVMEAVCVLLVRLAL